MKNLFYPWLISFLLIILFDFIWFSITVQKFYRPHLNHIISEDFKYGVATIFYILYSFGITYLVIQPAFGLSYTITQIGFSGFILGLVSYAAYNLTNNATILNWPVIVTFVDITWGATVTATVSCLTYKILKLFG